MGSHLATTDPAMDEISSALQPRRRESKDLLQLRTIIQGMVNKALKRSNVLSYFLQEMTAAALVAQKNVQQRR